jgi:hypothetical protein
MTDLVCCTPIAKAGDLWHTCRERLNERLSPQEKAIYRHPAGSARRGKTFEQLREEWLRDTAVQRQIHRAQNLPTGCDDPTCEICGGNPFDDYGEDAG